MPHSRIALETGMHSPWVSRVLGGLGHEVIVAGKKRAVIAVARKLAVLLHRLWAHRRVRMEGWRQWLTRPEKNLVQRKNKRTHLTPTGLLMEGVNAH
jgi:hypothetical protein